MPSVTRGRGRIGEPVASGVAIVGRGLAARGPRGHVFQGVDVDVPAGGLGVVHGPGGSGRSVLLLALGGRFRLVAGALRVGDHDADAGLAAVRAAAAVARLRPGIEPDEGLHVRDVVRQHALASGGAVRPGDVASARELLGVDAPESAVLGDLPPIEALLLVVALAAAEHRPLVLVDDVDHGLVPAERARAWDALDALAASGPTVVASALEIPDGVDHAAIPLTHPAARSTTPRDPALPDGPTPESRTSPGSAVPAEDARPGDTPGSQGRETPAAGAARNRASADPVDPETPLAPETPVDPDAPVDPERPA